MTSTPTPTPTPTLVFPSCRRQVFRSDFNTAGNLEGWNILRQPGNTSVQVTNGYLQLSTFGATTEYPVVERTGLPWPVGDMEIEWRFSSPDAAAARPLASTPGSPTASPRSAVTESMAARKATSGASTIRRGRTRQGLDTAWHTALIIRHGGVYRFYLDGGYKASWTYAGAPTWTAIGDPSAQTWAALWLTMRLDYYAVYDCPQTPTPTATPTKTRVPGHVLRYLPLVIRPAMPTSTPTVTASRTPTATAAMTATPTPPPIIAIPGLVFPNGLGNNLTKHRLYVASRDTSQVFEVDEHTGAVIRKIAVGLQPFGVAVNTTTDKIYVANFASDTLSVINGATGTVVRTISFAPYGEPTYVAVDEHHQPHLRAAAQGWTAGGHRR